jgi:DNA repair photolyase
MSRTLEIHDAARALTPTGGFLQSFAFSLNPYIGCAFGAAGGCPFCYVRALPVARAKPQRWGDWVIAKRNLPELLERELSQLQRDGKLETATIFMSSSTDPYQGAERSLRLTRQALELFLQFQPRRILLQTRSPMIERDLELLSALDNRVIASITVETDDESVRRNLTPTSPSIARRFETIRRLRAAGIFTQIAIAPMLPNNPERFAALVAAAADRAIVDTCFDGDGAHGRRSRALGMGDLYARLGYADWFHPGAEAQLMALLRQKIGADRVLFSGDGFNAV